VLYIIMGPVCLTKVRNFVHLTCSAFFMGLLKFFYEPLKQILLKFSMHMDKCVHTLVFSYKWYSP